MLHSPLGLWDSLEWSFPLVSSQPASAPVAGLQKVAA